MQVYVAFELFLFVILTGAYKARDEKLWALAAVLSGLLAMASYNIILAGSVNGEASSILVDSVSGTFNLALLIISGVWMFIDMYSNYGGPLRMIRTFSKKTPQEEVERHGAVPQFEKGGKHE